jgi:hypothetical protein
MLGLALIGAVAMAPGTAAAQDGPGTQAAASAYCTALEADDPAAFASTFGTHGGCVAFFNSRGPRTSADLSGACKEAFGFRNHGQCVKALNERFKGTGAGQP